MSSILKIRELDLMKIEEQRREIERLRMWGPDDLRKLREKDAEIERLRHNEAFHVERAAAQDVEIERLKAALQELRSITSIERMAEYHDGASLRHLVNEVANAALEGK